jgi:WD40 repeat protein/transcriptional regulator with XRE-family HTH domain
MAGTATFGQWMKQRRKALDLTQEELALQVGCSLSIIEKIESSVRRPSKQIADLLADHLQIPPAEREAFVRFARAAQDDSALNQLVPSLAQAPVGGFPPCPYRGLAAFRAEDAAFFFGRAAVAERLAGAVPTAPLVALVGPSGSGKSSVVMAGLSGCFPNLTVIRPGARPLDALAAVPASALLVVDQFEELYTLCPDAGERRQFVAELLRRPPAVDCGSVVLTLRADFLGHALGDRLLADALQGNTVVLGPMTRDELRQAIEGPAALQGVSFEAGLVERILRDVRDEPGNLPLLEFALTALWEQAAETQTLQLTHSGYTAIGGVTVALVQRAEEIYAGLSKEEQDLARRVFEQMVQPGEGTEDIRRQATRAELGEEGWGLAQWLAGVRLTVVDRETVEVVHEALIPHWDRLRGWLAADRQFRAWQERLRAALRQWEASGRDEGALLRGAPLAEAEGWLTAKSAQGERSAEMSAAERAYIARGLALREREAMEREAQRRRELEAAQRLAATEKQRAEEQAAAAAQLRRRAVYLAGALIVAALLALLALGAGWQANQNAQAARDAQAQTEAQRKITFSRELAQAALVNLNVDPERSALLALQALSVTYTTEAEDALRQALPAMNVLSTFTAHTAGINHMILSPDGTRLATTSLDNTARVWDAATGQALFTITATQYFFGVDFSPDGRLLATSVPAENTVAIWDATTGRPLLTFTQTERVYDVGFSPDGAELAGVLADSDAVQLWRLAPARGENAITARAVLSFTGHTAAVHNFAFSTDGARLATTSSDQTVKIWDVKTGQALATFVLGRYSATVVLFSPDGMLVAAGDSNGVISIFDVVSGQKVMNIPGHAGQIYSLDWSADGSRLVSGGADGLVRVWDVWQGAGRDIVTLVGHQGAVVGVAFDPAGTTIYAASDDGLVKHWGSTPRGELQVFTAPPGKLASLFSVDYSPDGTRLATAGSRGWVKIWDAQTGAELLNLAGHDPAAQGVGNVLEANFSPDGKLLATNGLDGKVILWNAISGQTVMTLTASCSTSTNYSGNTFDPTGRYLAAACSQDKLIRIWNVVSGAEQQVITHTGKIRDLAYSPDGTRIAAAANDRTARIWDLASGRLLLTLKPEAPGDPVSVAYSPDGTRLAVVGAGPLLQLYDANTGAVLLALTGHGGNVTDVVFSPDGTLLATASEDQTAKVWDAQSGQELFTLYGHHNAVYGVSFSPDGRRLVTASWDRTARVYAITRAELIAAARARVTRGLTEAECRKYLHLENVALCPKKP